MGIEAEADAICDGTDVLIPGIMEHVERSGIHSGDSIAVYPAWNLTGAMTQRLIEVTRQIALELGTLGLINIQYIVYHNEVYVIEANPRASRTVPYISKVTGVPMVDLAVRAMLGEKIRDMGYGTGLYRQSPYYAVKVPCFSFEKLADVDTHLGPEMKSTGEVLGIGTNLQEAIFKGLVAAGYKMRHQGGILVSVRDKDKPEAIDCARVCQARLQHFRHARHGARHAGAWAVCRRREEGSAGENAGNGAGAVRHFHVQQGSSAAAGICPDAPQGGRTRHPAVHQP